MADIWSGVNFGNSIINPGSVYQSYNPNTGQTTYGAPSAGWSGGMSMAGGGQAGPPVSTPTGTPVGASVFQNPALGYAPSGPSTNFTTDKFGNVIASPYSQNPSAFPDIKTATSLSSTDKNLGEQSSLLKSQNDALKNQQSQATPPGQKISGPSGLAGLKESDLARTSNGDIYRRDLAAEQGALAGWIAKNGKPTTPTAWLQFHDSVYKKAAVPGATEYLPTQQPAAPEIADDQGLIDLQKLESVMMAELKIYNDQILQAQSNLDSFTNETMRGTAAIGDQLGRTATLVQGEQWSLKQQRQADEDMLVKRLGLAQQAKGFALEQFDLKMQIEEKIYQRKRDIINDARQLRKDQQEAFAATFDLMLKSGMAKGSIDKPTMDFITKQSQLTGNPISLYVNALDAAYNDKLNSNIEMIKTSKGRDNYLTRIDKTTGKIISETFIGSDPAPSGGGGGGGGDPFKNVFLPNGRKYSDYQDDLAKSISIVSQDNNQWGNEWNYLSQTYGVPTDILDADLGKDQFYPKADSQPKGYSKLKNWWNSAQEKKKQGKSILSK